MLSLAFLGIPSVIGVEKTPGAIAITLILNLPRSLARGNTIPLTAPLVAAYTVWPFCPYSPAKLLTRIITPLYPFTSCCHDIAFAAYFATLKLPTTLTLSAY